jgi:hypothetical protein
MALSKCVGFYDRSGMPSNKTYLNWSKSAYNSKLGGWVLNLNHKDIQPTAGTPAGSGSISGSAIDTAFTQVDAYNATNPTYPWSLKIRLFIGESAATWMQNLGVGPITYTSGGNTFTTTAWWDTTYTNAFAQFMLKMAAYVPSYTVTTTNYGLALGANTQKLDGHPLLGEITESAQMTKYAETMMKDDFTHGSGGDTAAINAGWTLNADYNLGAGTGAHPTCMTAMHTAFATTPVSKAANPFVVISQANPKDEARTEGLIDYLVGNALSPTKSPNCGLPFAQAVMENNSLRANAAANCPGADTQNGGAYSDRNADYTSMYTKFATYTDSQATDDLALGEPTQPQPLCIQTSTYGTMGGTVAELKNTVTYATWLGARMIEFPDDSGGYTNIATSDAWWTGAIAGLIANDPPASGGIPPLSNLRRRHWRTFTHR